MPGRFRRAMGRVSKGEALSGTIGSDPDHHGGSYALTEEFTAVYRLHTLIPEDVTVYSATSGERIKHGSFAKLQARETRPFMKDLRMADLFYSFGIVNPGANTLHNFPKALQNLERTDGSILDLAAVDILRDRERCIRRYNQSSAACCT